MYTRRVTISRMKFVTSIKRFGTKPNLYHKCEKVLTFIIPNISITGINVAKLQLPYLIGFGRSNLASVIFGVN